MIPRAMAADSDGPRAAASSNVSVMFPDAVSFVGKGGTVGGGGCGFNTVMDNLLLQRSLTQWQRNTRSLLYSASLIIMEQSS